MSWFEVAEIDTKLINVEGMPGSGKSEMMRFVAEILAEGGTKASCFDENDMNHPADYAFHAFMREDQIKSLSPQEQQQLYSEGTKRLSGLIIPLPKISVSLFGKVIPYKIYDNLDWITEKPVMLEHWQSFAKKALMRSKLYIFTNCVLQNPVSEMMMRFDFSFSEIMDYIFAIYKITAGMNPVIIYLKCTDIKAHIEEESKRRNSSWLNSTIDYHTSRGFGKRNGLKGLSGYINCLEARQRIELKILKELPVEKLILTDPFENWVDAQSKICDYLKNKRVAAIF